MFRGIKKVSLSTMIWAITPIKSFKRPKSRLGDVLNLHERRVLVKYMLKKILLSQKKLRQYVFQRELRTTKVMLAQLILTLLV